MHFIFETWREKEIKVDMNFLSLRPNVGSAQNKLINNFISFTNMVYIYIFIILLRPDRIKKQSKCFTVANGLLFSIRLHFCTRKSSGVHMHLSIFCMSICKFISFFPAHTNHYVWFFSKAFLFTI